MAFKKIVTLALAAVAGHLMMPSSAMATGIPVYCYNCQEGSSNAAHAVLDGIRAQTEALLNGMDYVMRAEQKLATSREVALASVEQKIKNSYAMDPSLGAKPRVACAQMSAASMRAAAGSNSQAMRKVLAKNSSNHNMRNRGLAPNEPRREYAIKEIIEKLDDSAKVVEAGEVLLENEPVETSGVADIKALMNLLLNPFPVEEPSEADIKRIKETGTSQERENLARSIVMQKRTAVGQHVFDRSLSDNIQSIPKSKVEYLLKDIEPFLSEEDKSKLKSENLSKNQIDELMSTYRVNSSKWVADIVVSPSSDKRDRDIALMSAEILNQLWQLNQTNKQIAKLLAVEITREVSQSGLQSR
jgi:soluble cytochrome b562